MLIDEYKRRFERPSDQELRPISALSPERERTRRGPLLPPWVVIAGVLVVVVVVLFILGSNTGSNSNHSTTPRVVTAPKRHHHHHHAARTTPTPPAPQNVKLQLAPTGSVYVCLVDGNGVPLIRGTIYAVGQTIPTFTRDKLMLTLGNASVQMKVNGKPVAVKPSASSIGYLIQPSGTTPLPVAKQPKCA
jgi:hypothetical protein